MNVQLEYRGGRSLDQSFDSQAIPDVLKPASRHFECRCPTHLAWFSIAFSLFFFCFGNDTPLLGQGDRPVVVTTDSGVQYEGKVFVLPSISESAYSFSPYISGNDIVVIDDGLRLVMLNQNHVLPNFGDSRLANEISFEIYQRTSKGSNAGGLFLNAGPFNRYGHREFTFSTQTSAGMVQRTYVQGITKINPRFCILESLSGPNVKKWPMHVATGTIPKDVLREMLLRQIKDPKDPNEFFDLAFFFQQRGDYEQASYELLQIEPKFKDIPDIKERIRNARESLGQLYGRQILREIETRADVGQSRLATAFAVVKDKTAFAGDIQARFNALIEEDNKSKQTLVETRQKIFELITRIKNISPEQSQAIKRFKNELESELNAVNAPRLSAYLLTADAAAATDQEKISLAISGWLLGSNNAINNLSTTESLFIVRDLVQEYLTTGTSELRRSQILTELGQLEAGEPEYLDAMIKQMKPIAPPEGLANYTGERPIQFTVEIPGTAAHPEPKQYQCLAHLPPEYDPYRKYPLLLSMPGARQPLEQNLNMWAGTYNAKLSENLKTNVRNGEAMRNGYIVVAVDWRSSGQVRWGYSFPEHKIVLEALYQSLRKFSVDSDRVFLSGHGIGADGAYDIGISHPEHWAGVLGFSGKFGKYINLYRENSFGLPGDQIGGGLSLYCVNGQKDFAAIAALKDCLNKWMRAPNSKNYANPTVVQYIGRANEFFMEDMPEAFKWMRAQRRRWPDRAGFEFESDAMRPWDTYHWFFEMHGLPEKNIVRPALYDQTKSFKNKLTLKGEILNNVFDLEPMSMKIDNDATLWLSPEFMDFSKTVEIEGRGRYKGPAYTSRKVLLDDVLNRADREHPYWGKIECLQGEWKPFQ